MGQPCNLDIVMAVRFARVAGIVLALESTVYAVLLRSSRAKHLSRTRMLVLLRSCRLIYKPTGTVPVL